MTNQMNGVGDSEHIQARTRSIPEVMDTTIITKYDFSFLDPRDNLCSIMTITTHP